MSNSIGMVIESVVAFLLMLTIGYCYLLNRRLKMLKADEQSLRATISELVTATEIAERAIGGLKVTVHECDMTLGERLRKAERVTIELDRAVTAGKEVLGRVTQIVAARHAAAAVPAPVEAAAPRSNAQTVAAAAQALAGKLRHKVHGIAA
jgi:hypothetical protein